MFKKERQIKWLRIPFFSRKDEEVENREGYEWVGEPIFGLYPVEANGKLGFIDSGRKVAVPIIYDSNDRNVMKWMANPQYFCLRKNGKYGLIDHNGTEVVAFKWDDINLFNLKEDLLPVASQNKWGFINIKAGRMEVEPIYDEVRAFRNNMANVCIEDKWGIIDIYGNTIVKPKYLLPIDFKDDFAIVCEGGYAASPKGTVDKITVDSNCKIINKEGHEIVTDCLQIIRTGINTFTIIRKVNGKLVDEVRQFIPLLNYIIVIENGEYEQGCIRTDCKSCSHKYSNAKYIRGGTWSAINYTGKVISIPDFELQKAKKNLISNN